ncbi:lamin tail domain-containing protein, partial [Actinotalea ferrariae]|uniref:lamin tail domain-containing protein n=1 Tax=Actinotalea ferrariae TaxID=1386098 RepID=UPI000550255A
MSRPARTRRRSATSLLTAAAVLLGGLVPVALAPTAQAVEQPRLVVTEIAPDSASYDDYEYVELANAGSTDVDLTAEGVTLAYTYVDSDDRTRDVGLVVPEGTVVPAGGAVVLWLSYRTSTVDSFARTEADFREHWAAGAPTTDYPVVRISGQAGMANSGDRGIRVVAADGTAIGWSFYPAGSVAVDGTAHFALADGAAARLVRGPAAATPGAVEASALVPPSDPGPTPDPEPTPDPDPTPDPEPTPDPDP